MKPVELMALFKLAELGAHERKISITTGDLASSTGISQQTASRRLVQLEKKGLITRDKHGREQEISLTKEGVQSLEEMHSVLSRVFQEEGNDLVLNATVFSGMAEGSYYMGLEGYKKQFTSKLGFTPFPGTLNLRIKPEEISKRKLVNSYPSIWIEGFANEKRTYGAAKCYRATINGKVTGAIIVPVRAHYGDDVLEVIAADPLRKKLKLKDGDTIQVRILSG
jgi:riboflavin kinase